MSWFSRTLFLVLIVGAGFMIVSVDFRETTENQSQTDNNTVSELTPSGTEDTLQVRNSPVDASYDMTVEMNGSTRSTSRIRFVADKKYDKFEKPVRLPSGARVDSLRVSGGEERYSVDGDVASLVAELDRQSRATMFSMNYSFDSTYRQLSPSVTAVEVTAYAREERKTSLRVHTEKDVISAVSQTSSAYSVTGNRTVVARGNGTIQLTIVFGDPSIETDAYAFINGGVDEGLDPSTFQHTAADYQITRGVLGYERANMKIPVVIQTDEEFDSTGESGREQAGISYLPVSVVTDQDTFHKVLAHETTHVLNNYITSQFPRWFEEGSAQYAEAVVADYGGSVYVDPFNQQQYYPESCRQTLTDDCLKYSSGSSTRELYEYLEANRTSMRQQTWTGKRSPFRYSYSDLFVRTVAEKRYDGESLRPLYDKLQDDTLELRSTEPTQMSQTVLSEMGTSNMSVCNQYLAMRDQQLSKQNVTKCVQSYYEQPTYPESISEEYTTVDTAVEFVMAKEP